MNEHVNERSLENRIYQIIKISTTGKPGAWMTWCDPYGHWGPLLEKVAAARAISLISVRERTAGDMGSPAIRRQVQKRIERKESFVLHVEATTQQLGWLRAQALRSEKIYQMSLREQLKEWGWRPQVSDISDEKLAQHALVYLQQDPVIWVWGTGGLQPDILSLLLLLAAGTFNALDDRLHLAVDAAGLPELDEKNIERWRTYALVRLLVTNAYQLAPDIISNDHEYLIGADRREFALAVLALWTDNVNLNKGLPERILEADSIIMLGNSFRDAPLTYGPFISYTAERAVFANVCAQLAEKSGRELFEALAALEGLLQDHASGFWGDIRTYNHDRAIPWDELVRLSRAVKNLLAAMPHAPWANYRDIIDWYTRIGWQVEQAGDEILQYLSKPVAELLKLIIPLRHAYHNRWEDYMLQWSDMWVQAGCPNPAMDTQGMWLREQLKDTRPTAVLVIDALRYDLGVRLKDEINQRQGIERAQITAARTVLPTFTALGMGAALPIDECELHAKLADGQWQLYQQGFAANLSIAENRRLWLRNQYKLASDALLTIDAIEKGNIPTKPPKNARIFIFDDLIDKLGHDDNLEAIGTRNIQKRYVTAIEHLYDKGWLRVLIITDHGFIRLPDDREQRIPFPAPGPAFTSRRALAYPADGKLEGPQKLAPGGDWRIAFPRGAECFRTYGGLRFMHGGASLQEWIVPCVRVDWPARGKPIDIIIEGQKQLTTLHPRIFLEVKRETLFPGVELLARQVEIRIRDEQQKVVLFHSDPIIIKPDSGPVPVQLKPVEGVTFERGNELSIEVRDTRLDKKIAEATTLLMHMPYEGW